MTHLSWTNRQPKETSNSGHFQFRRSQVRRSRTRFLTKMNFKNDREAIRGGKIRKNVMLDENWIKISVTDELERMSDKRRNFRNY